MDRRDLMKFGVGVLGATAFSNRYSHGQMQVEQPPAKSSAGSQSLKVPEQGRLPVAFVIGKDAEVLDFCGPLEVFAGAWTQHGTPLFAPYMVSATKEPVVVGGGMRVLPDYSFQDAPSPKLIVIPAMDTQEAPSAMYDWIREASRETDITMSVCNGAFILAKTGLLDGIRCTSHHAGYFRFAGMFPDVHLIRGVRFVEDGKFASSGGVMSGIDLALRVVERYLGTESASALADGIEYQGNGWRRPDTNEAYATMPEFNENHPRCPLCLMEGDRSIKTIHDGKSYYFCSSDEKEFFDGHLDVLNRFLQEDSIRKAQLKN